VSWPTLPHIIYIPLMLGIGFLIGWKLGSQTVRGEWDRAEKRRRQREEEA
jgi:hypothetical protein